MDAEAVTDVDATAAEMLMGLQSELQNQDIMLALARIKRPLRETLTKVRLLQAIGSMHLFPSVRSGVAAFRLRGQAITKSFPRKGTT